jgi:predicted outer membrane repeat protein
MMSFIKKSVLFTGLFLCSIVSANAVLYVDSTRPGGNGSTWAQAFRTLEVAMVAGANQEIWVAQGTYTPSIVLRPLSGTQLYGGFQGNETQRSQRNPDVYRVAIDGQLVLKHVFDIKLSSPNVRIDGFRIIRGRATATTGYDAYAGGVVVAGSGSVVANCIFSNHVSGAAGGAMLIQSVPALIENCKFYNSSSPLGGALAINDSAAVISNCLFSGNTANGNGDQRGGAVWINKRNPKFYKSTFINNSAYQGGAIDSTSANLLIDDSSFTNNTASHAGGALALLYTTGNISRCSFRLNSCGDNGGALFSYYSPVNVYDSLFWQNQAIYGGAVQLDYKLPPRVEYFSRCRFYGNTATLEGGAFHSYARRAVLENCVFSGNSSRNGGAVRGHGGVGSHYDSGAIITLNHCVLVNNYAIEYGGAIANTDVSMFTILNSISWGNDCGFSNWDPGSGTHIKTKDVFNTLSSRLTTRYSNLETLNQNHYSSAPESHTGGISANPQFVLPAGPDSIEGTPDDDLRLNSNSTSIDRADGNYSPAQDIDFNPRFDQPGTSNQGTGPVNFADLGPYERIQYAELPDFSPNGGSFSSWLNVTMSSTTPGAVIRYTLDGSSPGLNSPIGTQISIFQTATLRARTYANGYAASDVRTATFTIADTDGDGLADWMETNTGTYLSPTNTGTNPALVDSDADNFSDGLEVKRGTDPNDPDSVPLSSVCDFDGDGKTDISIYEASSGNWFIQYSANNQLFQQQWRYGSSRVAPADYDGDGKADIAVYDSSSGNWYIRQSGNSLLRQQNWGASSSLPVPGDYDGDGKADIAIFDPPSGNWYILQSGNSQLRTQNWGYSASRVLPADYDGDGRTDVAIFDPPSGNWYILQSGNNQMRIQNWGNRTSRTVPADYDGDGKADIAIFDPPSGNWYILQSSNGQMRVRNWGYSASTVVPADYDGDGLADIAIYDPPSGNWYILQSSNNQMRVQNWGYSGTVPVIPFSN